MPFLDGQDQPIDLARRIDAPKGFAVTPGEADLTGGEKQSWNWGAAFRRNNELSALWASNSAWETNEPEAGFNPWDKIKGTPDEANFGRLVTARNEKMFNAIKSDIARENDDRKLLDSQPWWMGLITEGAASIASPTTLLPGGTFVKGAKGGFAIAKSAAAVGAGAALGTSVQEAALQGIEQTRTAAESATAIGASMFLGGLLGAGGSALLTRSEWQRGVAALDREVNTGATLPSPIYTDVLGKLKAVGMNDNEAAANAAIMQARYETRAARLGMDADELYREANLSVASGSRGLYDPSILEQRATRIGEQSEFSPLEYAEQTWQRTDGKLRRALAEVGNIRMFLERDPEMVQMRSPGMTLEAVAQIEDHLRELAKKPFVSQSKLDRISEFASDVKDNKGVVTLDDLRVKFSKESDDTLREILQRFEQRGDAKLEKPFVWDLKTPEAADQTVAAVKALFPERSGDFMSRDGLDEGLTPELWRRAEAAGFDGIRINGAAGVKETKFGFASREKGDLQGLIQVFKDGTLIRLFDTADASTFMHESGHLWLNELIADAARANAPQSLKDDLAKTLKWLGVDDASKIETKHHEQWARGFEEYLRDGKAPTPALAQVFEQFKEWLTRIYRALSDLGPDHVAISDEVRGVMDRMLATDEQIAAGRSSSSGSSIGAAAVTATDLDSNSVAGRSAAGLAAATAKMNPLLRALHSPSAAYREVATQLVENPVYLKKNFEAVASEPAVETLMKEYNSGLAKAIEATNDGYLEHRKAGGQLDKEGFREAVGKAMRRGDEDADPAVAKVARDYRTKVFDPLKKQAVDAGLLPADVSVDTAQSYFSRMWNGRAISADEQGFKAMVAEWVRAMRPHLLEQFDKETAERSAKLKDDALTEYQVERRIERSARFEGDDGAREVADQVFDTLTGRAGQGEVRPDFITIKARGPLKERTFNIPDLFTSSNGRAVEQYLESDVEQVARRYTRVMGADVELARKFGSVDLKDQIGKIREDYKALRDGVTDQKQLLKLQDREKADVSDLEAMRDMLRGTNPGGSPDESYSRFVRSFNHFNYLRSMGEVSLASLTETVRPAMVHGLRPYLETLVQTLTNMKGVRLSVAEANLAGNVHERVLGTRLATLSEIIDPYASRGPVEAFLENMTNIASKWNGIRLLTDMQKSIASVMTQDRVLGGVGRYTGLGNKEKAYLAYVGIDESMAGRIADQFAAHGETVDKVRVANTENWTDEVARRTYRAAINKDVDSIITTKGVADTPLFTNTPTGRAMLQFKSFALASHQRVLLRGLQEDQARFVGGVIAMTTIGMMTTWLKAVSGNRVEKLQDAAKNPGWWISEGLDKAGIFAVPMELANTFEKATSFNPIKSPIKAFDEGSAISQKNQNRNAIGSLLGPSFGTAGDIITVGGLPSKAIKGEDITQADKNAVERLMPFNSYFGLRQMLRYTINPQQPN